MIATTFKQTSLPPQLDCVDQSLNDALAQYRSPPFLKSEHGSPVFIADFGEGNRVEISLAFRLPNGKHLSDPKYQNLRTDIHDILCLQTLRAPGRRPIGPNKQKTRILKCVPFIDWALRNHHAKLINFGFSSLTSQDLISYIRTVARSNRVLESIYGCDSAIANYIIQQGRLFPPLKAEELVNKHPAILDTTNIKDAERGNYSDAEIISGRLFLMNRQLYNKCDKNHFTPNTKALSDLVYSNTLFASCGTTLSPNLSAFIIGEKLKYNREFSGVPVKSASENPRCHEKVLDDYIFSLAQLTRLNPFDTGIAKEALEEALSYDVTNTIPLKPKGHTTPLPTPAGLYAIRRAIEFYYSHADHILESLNIFIALANYSGKHAPRNFQDCDVGLLMAPGTKAMGTRAWSLISINSGIPHYNRAENYHAAMRANYGLLELGKVLFGAMQCIVGTMLAGRKGEMIDLTANNISPDDLWAQLSTRKSGFGSIRRTHWRPIPTIVAEILHKLQKFQNSLRASGVDVPLNLFASPTVSGNLSTNNVDSCFDAFCDYIEMPRKKDGRRYYIREHQLRQFFILAFFYSSGITGVDTLRWFVRHYDPAHLWSYLRQNIPGATMMRYKSVALNSLIRNDAPEVADLALFLLQNLGAARLDVMSDEDLIEHLEELQRLGGIVVEPVFMTMDRSKTWRLGVTIFGERCGETE